MAQHLHDAKSMGRSLALIRDQIHELYGLIRDEERAAVRRWDDEKPSLESVIKSMTQGQEILKNERKRVKQQLFALQAKLDKADFKPKQTDLSGVTEDVLDLQLQLVDLNNRLLDIDIALKNVNTDLAECTKLEEKEIHSTRLVVLQEEINVLRSSIMRLETAAKLEAEKQDAEQSGWGNLSRLEEQLNKTTARIDKAKQLLYFPEVKGYRFSTGNGGIYLAAKDLFLSELSGRFTVDCSARIRPDGSKVARLSVALGGVTGVPDRSDIKANGGNFATGAGAKVSSSGTHVSDASSRKTSRMNTPPQQQSDGGVAAAAAAATASTAATAAAAAAAHSLAANSAAAPPSHSQQRNSRAAADDDTVAERHEAGSSLATRHSQGDSPTADTPTGSDGMVSSDPLGAITSAQADASQPRAPSPFTNATAAAAAAAADISTADAQLLSELPQLSAPQQTHHPSSHGHSHDTQTHHHHHHHHAGGKPPTAKHCHSSTPGAAGHSPQAPSTPGSPHPLGKLSHKDSNTSTPDVTPSAASASTEHAFGYQSSPHRGQHSPGQGQKGEMVSSFLSALSKKKDKLKNIISRDSSEASFFSLDSNGAGQAGAASRLGNQVMGSISEGFQDGKGKLSKFARAVASKTAPLKDKIKQGLSSDKGGRKISGSYGPASEKAVARRSTDGLSRVSNSSSAFSQPMADEQILYNTHEDAANTDVAPDEPVLLGDIMPTTAAAAAAAPSSATAAAAAVAAAVAAQSMAVLQTHSSMASDISLGLGAGSSSAHSSELGDADNTDLDSLFTLFEEFEAQPSRKGVYLQLLGERVEVIGERGTKVPDMSMRELLLEVELVMSATLEYSPALGWQVPEKVQFNILQLEHKMRGNNIPLPKAALRALLNLYVPGAMTKVLVSSVPAELGQYILESGEDIHVSGEFKVQGQALSTMVADLAPSSKPPPEPARRAKWLQQQAAAARGRSLVGLSEPQAVALAELFSTRVGLLDAPRTLSVSELCRMYMQYSGSDMWSALCALWNKALQVVLEQNQVSERLNFAKFMEGPVARLVRKPVRITFNLNRLSVAINPDVALASLCAYFERVAKEFHKKAQGGGSAFIASEPLDVQLENLSLWHQSMLAMLHAFKARFQSAGCSLMVAADREVFQFGADNLHYDGPLRLQVPLEVVMDSDGSFVWDIKLPDRQEHQKSVTTMLQEVMFNLSGAVQSKEASRAGTDDLSRRSSLTRTSHDLSATMIGHQAGQQPADAQLTTSLSLPVLEDPVIGQLSVKRASFGLVLDEERVAELLGSKGSETSSSSTATGGPRDVTLAARLLGCYGDLFTASLDMGWRALPDEDGMQRPRCMLKVQNNEVTRMRADVDSLVFQSSVSPQLAIRMLYAVWVGVLLRFYNTDSYQMQFWEQLFLQLHEYMSKDALDIMACLSVRAEVVSGQLRVVLSGDKEIAFSQGLGNRVYPVYLVNDVNLLTMLDSLKLLSEPAS